MSVSAELVGFVRQVLGCGCPEDVVAATVFDRSERGEPGLDVGGRLLVRVIQVGDVDRNIDQFRETVERLRVERDHRGFNRLRLVVVQPSLLAEPPIPADVLALLAPGDERIFLHTVTPEELPAVLRS